MESERASGILLHISSLPSQYGIGDFGPESYKFVDFLHQCKQKVWQILPLTHTEKCSPYSAISAFAGYPLLISPDKLLENNLLTNEDLILPSTIDFDNNNVKFKQVTEYKYSLLKKAFHHFQKQENNEQYQKFIQSESYWLDDYSLYMTIKEKQGNQSWSQWPHQFKYHQKQDLDEIRLKEKDLIDYYQFIQFIFDQQWSQLKSYANQFNIRIIGDMPVYVDYDSVDVWANTQVFQLDTQTLLPTVVSGFPPDDCSAEGQNWNMPIYQWNDEQKKPQVFDWWIKRLRKTLQIVDIVRIDHFRGLESFWAIPVDQNHIPLKPKDGKWVKAPGVEFFTAVFKALGNDLPLIVEDLGGLTQEVFDLRDQFHLTGIRILQFGFSFHPDNIYRPHNYIPNSIAYTGTHDNPTVIGWWTKCASDDEKKTFYNYIKFSPSVNENENENEDEENRKLVMAKLDRDINWYIIQMVLSTSANTAIIQFQDLLGLDDRARMNDPSLASNPDDDGPQNWTWRFQWSMLKENQKNKLKFFTLMYNRDGLQKQI